MKHSQEQRRRILVGLRMKLDLSLKETASGAGISRISLSLWEKGYRTLPKETVDQIEEFLTNKLAEAKALSRTSDQTPGGTLRGLGPRRPEKEN